VALLPCLAPAVRSLTPRRRWKQRDIHEKREVRTMRIDALGAEIACNEVLLARLRALLAELEAAAASADMPVAKRFSNEVERLRTSPSPAAPPSHAAQPVSYDEMIRRLLDAVASEAAGDAPGAGGALLDGALVQRLKGHVQKLAGVIAASTRERDALEAEKRKTITMEDMHEGFESKVRARRAPGARAGVLMRRVRGSMCRRSRSPSRL
jgi:cell division cycle protein 37